MKKKEMAMLQGERKERKEMVSGKREKIKEKKEKKEKKELGKNFLEAFSNKTKKGIKIRKYPFYP